MHRQHLCVQARAKFHAFFVNDEGATAIEYALIASLISVAILTALVALGSGTDNMFGYIMSNVSPALAGK